MPMPIFIRLRYTAATSGRSSGVPVSFSTSDASVTSCRTVRPALVAAARSSGVITFLKPSTICATTAAALRAARQRVGFGKQVAFEIARGGIEIGNQRRRSTRP